MTDSIKRRCPGGKVVSTAGAYMQAWREALRPFLERTGWVIHSFLPDGVLLMDRAMKHKQAISLEFFDVVANSFDAHEKACTVVREGKVTDDQDSRELRNDERASWPSGHA